MRTNASTDKGIWGLHSVNIEVRKRRVWENVPNASCATEEEAVLGCQGVGNILDTPDSGCSFY